MTSGLAAGKRDRASKRPLAHPSSNLLECLVIAARHRGVPLSVEQIVREHDLGAGGIVDAKMLTLIASAYGLRAVTARMKSASLVKLNLALPAIVLLRDGGAGVLLRVTTQGDPRFTLQLPHADENYPLVLDEFRFDENWAGRVILIKKNHRLQDEEQPFSMRLIVGMILSQGRIARDIGVSAFLMSLLALSPILFWRLLIDEVLYYGRTSTFFFLCAIMLALIVLETIFGYLRRFLVNYVSRNIEVALSSLVFNRMLNLPIDYFERRQTGEIGRDVTELWKIRNFLTGELFGTLLDSVVILVLLPVMFFFSVLLTLFVIGIGAIVFLWLILMLPVLHRKAGAVFASEGVKSSFLVETLHGVRTVKSLALDASRRREWDRLSARTAELRFEESRVSNLIQTVITPLERLMTAGVFSLAVYLALETPQSFSIGSLIAFMMFTMRLTAPLGRLASLLPEYDEAKQAVDVIAAMVTTEPEAGRGTGGLRAPLRGKIEFKDVRFRYPGATSVALDGVSFEAPEGSIIGVMGRSGSGKTTITRLLQMLHTSYEGQIKIDGFDARGIELDHLRTSIGIVLQENFLFRGSIRDIIAAAKPHATMDEIVEAARLAGADEFIDRLPRGYETWIEEGSSNLSGGQRQRLAIARALITSPSIFILDEATSALDAESEAIVNANLQRIAHGRTMIIVSHRLSSLVNADAIIVLERGRVVDLGRHEQLLDRSEIYSWLWHQQHRHLQQTARP